MHELVKRIADLLTKLIGNAAILKEGYKPVVLLNPQAGIFKSQKKQKETIAILETMTNGENPAPVMLCLTERPGHAKELIREIDFSNNTFLVSAGGDGTHQEVLSALMQQHVNENRKSDIVLYRLPLGTGNDSAENDNLETAIKEVLTFSETSHHNAVTVDTASGRRYFAGKICSLGIDAYVTHMTNRLKYLPGDVYKLIADASTLFYDKIYGTGQLELYDEEANTLVYRDEILLCAIGPEGHSSYGDHKFILPDDNNVCIIRKAPLKTKLKIKKMVYAGKHASMPGVTMMKLGRFRLDYSRAAYFQFEGEAFWFVREDFPLAIKAGPVGIKKLSS